MYSRIIYTCPICGKDLHEITLLTDPPQFIKECFGCGWRSDAQKENVIRVPYQMPEILECTSGNQIK